MDENKHLHRRDDDDLQRNDADDDQLRGNTANEVIREVHGGPDADISSLNDEGSQLGGLGRSRNEADLTGTDRTQGTSYDPNDASAVRSGGTTDMDNQTASGGTGLGGLQRGAGTNIDTKRNVTGSDFDGQNATS